MAVQAFAKWLEPLHQSNTPGQHAVYCPEGLSRFYWGGFSGKPVASWMTSEARLHEIEDFCTWLDQVYAFAKTRHPGARVVALGFSQGAATVMRWAQARQPTLYAVVLWSGTPPEDIDYAPAEYWDALSLLSRWGDADELVPYARARERFEEVGLDFEHAGFVGGHRVTADGLLALAARLAVG